MKHWKLSNGYQLIQLLSGRSNVYMIETPEKNFLIDTSVKRNRKKLLKNITKTGTSKIDSLIVTHTHFDHCENARFLQAKFGCRIICSEQGAEYAKAGKAPIPKGTNLFTKTLVALARLFFIIENQFEGFYPDELIHDYDFFNEIFPDIEIILTPGHSSDSVSILVNNEIAIVGDAMFGIFPGSVFPPFSNDVFQMVESWRKLLETGCSLFLPGHGLQRTREKLQKGYLKQSKG